MIEINKIYCGNCLEVLKTLPDECVDCVITSPPYWSLRDYKVEGQLGLESTFEEFINKLCDIFDEVKRVLKKEGNCWIVIGDTYISQGKDRHKNYGDPKNLKKGIINYDEPSAMPQTIFPKCLAQIPSRFSIEMTNRGWILRNEIIWHKPNCMPCSVKDRFTVDFEKIFLFVKNRKYFFETQYEPYIYPINRWGGIYTDGNYKSSKYQKEEKKIYPERGRNIRPNNLGRNMRCVWRIPTQPFKGAHFATFPEKLIEPMIKAGCPEFICKKCGKTRRIITKRIGEIVQQWGERKSNPQFFRDKRVMPQKVIREGIYDKFGFSDCGCNVGFDGGVVLDLFMGAGTTALVALKLNRQFLGIELNPEYIKIAMERIKPFLEQKKLI